MLNLDAFYGLVAQVVTCQPEQNRVVTRYLEPDRLLDQLSNPAGNGI
jgi:hypothetical protein